MEKVSALAIVLDSISVPIMIVGLIGNVLVVRIVHKTRAMHTTTNYLLVNLAVSDVCTILIWPLILIDQSGKLPNENPGIFLCKAISIVDISATVSSFTLTILAIERYHALLKPMQTGLRLTEDNIRFTIGAIWVASCLVCLPELIFRDYSESSSSCMGPWTLKMNKASKIYTICYSALITYLPLSILIFCYGALISGLYCSYTVCAAAAEGEEERESEKKKLLNTFILATAGFFLCYSPLAIYFSFIASKNGDQINENLTTVLGPVFYFWFFCSVCFNPILYASRSTNFRNGLKRIFMCHVNRAKNDIQL